MITAVASGKGGTGKTTLSVNLAAYLTSEIKSENQIVLADLDVEEPNSGLFIGRDYTDKIERYRKVPSWDREKCILCGKCDDYCRFNAIIKMGKSIVVLPEVCHSCRMCTELCPQNALPFNNLHIGTTSISSSDNLIFIESRLDIGQEQAVPLIKQTLDHINKKYGSYEHILLDCPPGTSCPMIESVHHADFVLLVTEPTPFGFHDLKLAIETMQIIGKDFAVVINRYGSGNNEVEDYCEQNNIDIAAKFPDSRKAAELYSEGKLIYEELPEFRSELEKLSKYLGRQKK